MSVLTAAKFSVFFQEIYGNDRAPFPWQVRLADRVCDESRHWPRAIALPTAAGKTACIDLAVFSLACQADLGARRTAPRRVFFVVDRRMVVDQAFEHAKHLAERLASATTGVCREVAEALRKLADSDRPLDVYSLRGGMYRETAWTRSPLQPTIIATTVDQVGSRLLFRGYGVSDSMKPVHAGLVGNDSLILLDEAHCARPFEQTTRFVEKYRTWGDDAVRPPFQFVSITATPGSDLPGNQIEGDQEDDRSHPILGPRITVSKPMRLITAERAKGKAWKNWGPPLVACLAEQAQTLMGATLGKDGQSMESTVCAVGIIVNRVATARELARKLRQTVDKGEANDRPTDVILLTGRMRPVDRDIVHQRLRPLFSGSKERLEGKVFVVATQCIEVGADLDFHALITECASLDALRQRFGRLNRVAARPRALGAIVVRADQTEDSETDPVYGQSLANTWKWLKSIAADDVVDFGANAIRQAAEDADVASLNAPSLDAPVLFPSYLDCWVQTYPIPTPDPDPAVFLHGPRSGGADVQVVFRDDLSGDPVIWADIVALCSPSASEALPVPIDLFRRWLTQEDQPDDSGDVESEARSGDATEATGGRLALRWSGPSRSQLVSRPSDVRPGDTFVVRTSETGTETLGDFPTFPPSDCGDEAFQRSRDRAILRLASLKLDADDEDFEAKLTAAIKAQGTADSPEWKKRAIEDLASPNRRKVMAYPLGGWVVVGRQRLHQNDPYAVPILEDDESNESPRRRAVALDDHSRGVAAYAKRFAAGCGLDTSLYGVAGLFHDLGKLDPRFQAKLKARSPRTTGSVALAKSAVFGAGDPAMHRYPANGRHELLSAAMVAGRCDDDLLLHLLATSHGAAGPFASPVEENDAARSPFTASLFGHTFSIDSCAQTPDQWNPELAERFWRMVRKYGWWGIAFREAVFRLADHACSRDEQEGTATTISEISMPSLPAPSGRRPPLQPLELTGLDGSNPLAFLAAVGTLRLADHALDGEARLSWIRKGHWTPVLHIPHDIGRERLLDRLYERVHRVPDQTAEDRAKKLHRQYRVKEKAVNEAMKSIKDRKLRGAEREEAVTAEVMPLRQIADEARASWLQALDGAVAAPFLSLGKALAVTADEFRAFTVRTSEQLEASGMAGRADADFATAFGCEACVGNTGRIIPTEFQLITGSGHQFFLETLGMLMARVTPNQLERALFGPWVYKDSRLSFRWDPLDDRRYAYSWSDPSDEEVRTEHGANLLAAFGLPLFPLIPTAQGPVTTGFQLRDDLMVWTWPLWSHSYSVDVVRSLLALRDVNERHPFWRQVSVVGIAEVFGVEKIEVGRPPLSKLNLTAAVRV